MIYLVASQVAVVIRLIAERECEPQQIEAHSRCACINQNEHSNVLGEAGAHTPDGDLHGHS